MRDGGPAFPQLSIDRVDHHPDHGTHAGMVIMGGGMSLRDYFAAAALQTFRHGTLLGDTELSYAAEAAYKIADAMLTERDRK